MVDVKYCFELKTLKNQSLAFSIVVQYKKNPKDFHFKRRVPLSFVGFQGRSITSPQKNIFDQKHQINLNLKVGIK